MPRIFHTRSLRFQLQCLIANRLDTDLCFTVGIHDIAVPDIDVDRITSTEKSVRGFTISPKAGERGSEI